MFPRLCYLPRMRQWALYKAEGTVVAGEAGVVQHMLVFGLCFTHLLHLMAPRHGTERDGRGRSGMGGRRSGLGLVALRLRSVNSTFFDPSLLVFSPAP